MFNLESGLFFLDEPCLTDKGFWVPQGSYSLDEEICYFVSGLKFNEINLWKGLCSELMSLELDIVVSVNKMAITYVFN